jgi:hypothetical protein
METIIELLILVVGVLSLAFAIIGIAFFVAIFSPAYNRLFDKMIVRISSLWN